MEKMGTTVPLLENPFHSFWTTSCMSLDIGVLKVSDRMPEGKRKRKHVLFKKIFFFGRGGTWLMQSQFPTRDLTHALGSESMES